MAREYCLHVDSLNIRIVYCVEKKRIEVLIIMIGKREVDDRSWLQAEGWLI